MKKIIKIAATLFMCLLFFLFSCKEEQEKNLEDIENIRKVVKEYSSTYGDEKNWNIYKKYSQIPDNNISYINEISYLNYSKIIPPEQVISTLDSFKDTPNFTHLNNLNKYYTYYYLSLKYNQTLQSELAFNNNIKANSYIENDFDFFMKEKSELKNLLIQISYNVFNNKAELIQVHQREVEKYKKENNVFQQSKHTYIMGLIYYEIGNYKKSLEYIKLAQNYYKNNNENPLYIDEISLMQNNYRKLNHLDSMFYIEKLAYQKFKNKQISLYKFYSFMALTINNYQGIIKNERIEQKYDSIFAYFPKSCLNRYFNMETYKAQSFFNKYKKDIYSEKTSLLNGLEIIDKCGNMDASYLQEKERILKRLIEIDLQLNNIKGLNTWYAEKNTIEKLKSNQTNLFLKLTQYFTEREIENINRDLNEQKQKVSTSKKMNILYSILVLMFIFAGSYIGYLYFKNRNYQNKLKKGSEKLKTQNNTISIQNKKMKKLVNALQESNENLHNFARVVAHDIKSPISSIHNAINYIGDKYQKTIETEDNEIFQYLNKSTLNLNNMINVLLEYSSSNKNIIKDEKVETLEIVQRVINNLNEAIIQSNATIHYPDNLPAVKANESLIEQLFLNIISNAIKFRKPEVPLVINLTFENADNSQYLFTISDNGIGIDPKFNQEIFKVFKKANQYKKYEGSGIGLAICKKIVEDFNGNIWVQSKKGEETHFYFTLPAYKAEKFLPA